MTLGPDATTIVLWLTYAGLVFSGVCGAIRLLKGESLADRVIALDVVLISLMSGIAVDAAATGSGIGLDLLVVVAIIGFTAAVAATRFVEYDAERRGRPESSAESPPLPEPRDPVS